MSRTIPPLSAPPRLRQTLFDSANPSPLTSASIVKQEANLLRFPFFALGRKGLRNQKGLLIRGRSTLDNETYDFEYCITCNSNDIYPGQFARKVHMALLRLMQSKQSFPFTNPIEFTFRELMEAMKIAPGGANLQCIKQALRSIHGTCIRSKFALKNGEGKHLKSRERGYSLYSEYVFFDELMPDNKTVADKNFLWLADWYLNNINSLYCSPLDYAVWQTLDEKSPIASRLYEFFTFNFSGDWNTLPIDYEKLARFLPVAEVRHLSQIEQQLGKALQLIVDAGVLSDVKWQQGKHGQPQLVAARGPLLSKRGLRQPANVQLDDFETTKIQDLYRQARPEDELVTAFHSLWDGNQGYQPSSTERTRARDILRTYGPDAEKLIPFVVEIMRERFAGAKSFGASCRYWPDAVKDARREQNAADRRKQQLINQELEEGRARQNKEELKCLQIEWDKLSATEKSAIQQRILAKNPPSLKKFPDLLHRLCLRELERSKSVAA
jgi:hypothetical protein